jgi:tetratricopeptide (TPR) repeat protein
MGQLTLQGKYREVEGYRQMAEGEFPNSVSQSYEAGLYALVRGRTAHAKKWGENILRLHDSGASPFLEVATLGFHVLSLTAIIEGNLEASEKMLASLKQLVINQENEYDFLYEDALARQACFEGDFTAARAHFHRALNDASSLNDYPRIIFRDLISDGHIACLEKSGAYDAVLKEAEAFKILTLYPWTASHGMVLPRVLQRKARAYEALDHIQQAVETYDELLEIWKDADADNPDLQEVRANYNRLKATLGS